MKFKKGDIVRCIEDSGLDNKLINNVIYIIKYIDTSYNSSDYIELGNFNFPDCGYNGFFPRRFKKVSSRNMSSKECFEYIKYKLGVRDEC